MDEANTFLRDDVAVHNARFAVVPDQPHDAHRRWYGTAQELARICAIHHERVLSKDVVISFRRQRSIVQPHGSPCYRLRGQRVSVEVYSEQRVEVLHGKKVLPVKVFDPAQDVPVAVDEKTLTARVE